MCAEGLRYRDGIQPAEAPQLLTIKIVGPHFITTGGDQLRTGIMLPDERRRPIRPFIPIHSPLFLTSRGIQRNDEGLLIIVIHDK